MAEDPVKPASLRLSLLENGYEFLIEALRKVQQAETEPSSWKLAIFNLVQAIELMLKERLRREHPILVYRDIDRPEKRDRSGNAVEAFTVTLDQAIHRLAAIADVHLDAADVAQVSIAKRWRNQIAHFEVEVEFQKLKPVFAQLLGFVFEFHQKQFSQPVLEHVPKDLWERATAIEEYFKEISQRATARIAGEGINSKRVWRCRKCGSQTFVTAADEGECFVCGSKESLEICTDCLKTVYAVDAFTYELDENVQEGDILCSACHSKRMGMDEAQEAILKEL